MVLSRLRGVTEGLGDRLALLPAGVAAADPDAALLATRWCDALSSLAPPPPPPPAAAHPPHAGEVRCSSMPKDGRR